MLKVAVAKGRIAEKVSSMLDKTNAYGNIIDLSSRKLIFTDESRAVQFFLVKPADLLVYVESGAADVGIIGKDILMETQSPVYEILDLKVCSCKMVVAGLSEKKNVRPAIRRIATKYPRITADFFESRSEPVEIIKLDGSIELAPLAGLSDAIVDIVESGRTLKENGLVVYEDICGITARVVANRVSYKLKNNSINAFVSAVRSSIDGGEAIVKNTLVG
ncbi:MAG: ATP phosphoribosyltransferase [Caulobacteraceae bacterium]